MIENRATKKTVIYTPVFENAEGKIGVDMGYESRIEALDWLARRNMDLIQKDKRQWVKVVTIKYEEIV